MDRSIASGFFSVIGAKVFLLVLGTLTTPLLYRLLGPTKFGTYSFVLSIFMLFMIFVSSGVGDGVRKFLAEDRYIRDWNEHVVGFYFRLALVLSLAGAGVLALAAKFGLVGGVFGDEFTPYFYLLAVLVVTSQFREFSRRTLMGFGLERYSEPLEIANRVTFVALALALVWKGQGVRGMLLAHIAGSLLSALAGFALVARHASFRGVLRRPPVGFPKRELLTFNSMSIVLVLLLTSLYNVDVIMLQPFAGSTQVGHYKAALKLAEFLWFVPVAIQTVFVHSTSELWSEGKREQISELATRATRYTFLLTAVMGLGLAALAPVAVPLYFGSEATPAVTPLILLLPGALGLAVARPILAISQGSGNLRYPIYATGVAAAINLAMNLLLIPRYGMNGAAVSTSVGYGSMFVFHLWSARKVGFDPLADARLGRVLAATAAAALPIMALPDLLGNDLVALAVVPPAGLAVFLVAALATNALGVGELLDVLARFPAPIGPAATGTAERIRRIKSGTNPERAIQRTLLLAGVLLFASGIGFGVIGPDIASSSSAGPDDGIPARLTTMTPENATTTETTAAETRTTATTGTPTATETTGDDGDSGDDGGDTDDGDGSSRPPSGPSETTTTRTPTATATETRTTTETTMTTTTTRTPENGTTIDTPTAPGTTTTVGTGTPTPVRTPTPTNGTSTPTATTTATDTPTSTSTTTTPTPVEPAPTPISTPLSTPTTTPTTTTTPTPTATSTTTTTDNPVVNVTFARGTLAALGGTL